MAEQRGNEGNEVEWFNRNGRSEGGSKGARPPFTPVFELGTCLCLCHSIVSYSIPPLILYSIGMSTQQRKRAARSLEVIAPKPTKYDKRVERYVQIHGQNHCEIVKMEIQSTTGPPKSRTTKASSST
jgi:hypothetical protein